VQKERAARVVDLRPLPAMHPYFRVNPNYVTEKTPTLLSTFSPPILAQYMPTLVSPQFYHTNPFAMISDLLIDISGCNHTVKSWTG